MRKKIIHVLKRFFQQISKTPQYYKEFGLKVSLFVMWDNIFLRPKSKSYIRTIGEWTNKVLEPVWKEYESGDNQKKNAEKKKLREFPIWVCWFQGEENMPELVRICYQSIKNNLPEGAKVYLITYKNINHFVSIDEFIQKKYENNEISKAFYSDIIRYLLLRDYGGMWIDSTILVTSQIPKSWFEFPYYTMKMREELCCHEACRGKWTNFCFSGEKENLIFRYTCDALNYYLEKKSLIPDYVFLDYVLMAGYNNISEMRTTIDSVEWNNDKIWEMKKVLEEPFEQKKYSEIVSNNIFHKLAHQVEYQKYTDKNELTFYGYLCKNILKE